MLQIENIIYIYGAICFSLILFNGFTIIVNKGINRRINKKDRRLDNLIYGQIVRMREGLLPDEFHLKKMEGMLHHIGNLRAFEEIMDKVVLEDEKSAKLYLYELYPVMIRLAKYYRKKMWCILHIL